MLIKKRHPISSKEMKELLERASGISPRLPEVLDRKKGLELVELASGERVYLQDRRPVLIELGGKLMPALTGLEEALSGIPRVVVDMGAVPFICNGADVMAPGIRSVPEGVKPGDVVIVSDERHGKSLAVGLLMMEREGILRKKKGKAVKNVHHVGDAIWKDLQKI
ncbi:MAG: RNA-binding protein [Candidatus Verstraetearchaeota archaeon]|nr:RNA-binding protein [Candidatus Verstraetearchaeota archaeon]